jgi:hypothetical protein
MKYIFTAVLAIALCHSTFAQAPASKKEQLKKDLAGLNTSDADPSPTPSPSASPGNSEKPDTSDLRINPGPSDRNPGEHITDPQARRAWESAPMSIRVMEQRHMIVDGSIVFDPIHRPAETRMVARMIKAGLIPLGPEKRFFYFPGMQSDQGVSKIDLENYLRANGELTPMRSQGIPDPTRQRSRYQRTRYGY